MIPNLVFYVTSWYKSALFVRAGRITVTEALQKAAYLKKQLKDCHSDCDDESTVHYAVYILRRSIKYMENIDSMYEYYAESILMCFFQVCLQIQY